MSNVRNLSPEASRMYRRDHAGRIEAGVEAVRTFLKTPGGHWAIGAFMVGLFILECRIENLTL